MKKLSQHWNPKDWDHIGGTSLLTGCVVGVLSMFFTLNPVTAGILFFGSLAAGAVLGASLVYNEKKDAATHANPENENQRQSTVLEKGLSRARSQSMENTLYIQNRGRDIITNHPSNGASESRGR